MNERHENEIGILLQEMAEYMNRFKEGHVHVEVAKDDDEGEIYYIADIFVHGYVDQEDGTTDVRSRSFEIGYSNDLADAESMAKKGHETIAKLCKAANFELNEKIEYTDY
ncbi:hypothetical protein [Bacillus andreraoultii]|uniref:hypothetical protein n=1 Tax=Bacillus andreraoultii TaxID=1499685 RepID=UPI00053B83C4|nr:hypothetical protein [Bacillus andreraoultii]